MKYAIAAAAIIGWGCGIQSAVAQQPYPPLDDWQRIPEDQTKQEFCMPQFVYGTAIAALFNRDAAVTEILRWEEREAEKTISENPTMDPFDAGIGSQMVMTTLITHARWDEQIYSHIPGGFPQWAFRSCLKGKSLK